jgi:hypothetical protein
MVDDAKAEAEKAKNKGYTYWKRDIADADVLPACTPKKLDETTQAAEQDAAPLAQASRSRWNSAGTWEEKEMGPASRTELEQILSDPSFPLLEGEDTKINASSVTVTGDASLYNIRGRARLGYEFKVRLDWSGTFNGAEASGRISIEELDSSDLDGIEIKATPSSSGSDAAKDASKKAAEVLKKGARPAFKRVAEELQKRMLER